MSAGRGSAVLPQGMNEAEFAALTDEQRRAWLDWFQDVQWLLQQPQFRRVALRLIDDPEFCGSHANAFDPNSQRGTDFQLGRQSVGQTLRSHLQHIGPRLWRRALNEEHNARESTGGNPQQNEDTNA